MWKLAGVKDASDKRILVDMLFWAVDNPAPANYLLISGDQDFSNALHQLSMRRYNILLAQPQQASAPLLSAAKSIWLYTSLLAGGPPIVNGELQQLVNNNSYSSSSNTLQMPVSNAVGITQPMKTYQGNPHIGNHSMAYIGKGVDSRYQGKSTSRNFSQANGSKPLSLPVEHYSNVNSHQPGNFSYIPNVPPSGPAQNFVHGNPGPSWSNSSNHQKNHQYNYSLSLRPNNFATQPAFSSRNMHPPPLNTNTFVPPLTPLRLNGSNFASRPHPKVPDIKFLNISGYSNSVHNPPTVQQRNQEPRHISITKSSNHACLSESQNGYMVQKKLSVYPNMLNNGYPRDPEYPSLSSAEMGGTSTCILETPKFPKPSGDVQGLLGVILLALDTLKNEKIMPTEANIIDCIQYGDPKHRYIDIKNALESAIEQQMVVKHISGDVQLYVPKNEKLWHCVNPIDGNPNRYSKVTWDETENFLTSPAGRSAIIASQCKYEAASILRNMCLKELALGDILQILNMVITVKKWIVHHLSGWQPIVITVAQTELT
ncbi:uncharacterized protein LOC142626723 isoform X2 [Castanea sativa]|uniref:uncharacterized protein LOC142626723 isoform X2 n=1 Tax=Castanea sativa TaxID=21020 RepID=UPI003F64D469